MARRGCASTRLVFGDQNKQKLIDQNTNPPFKRFDECWIADEQKAEVLGPFKFDYYSPQSCVVLDYHGGHCYQRRVKFMHGQRIFQTEKQANGCIMVAKVLKYVTMQAEMEILHQEILDLSEGRIKL